MSTDNRNAPFGNAHPLPPPHPRMSSRESSPLYIISGIYAKNKSISNRVDIVDGTEVKPEETQPEFKAWRKNDAKARRAILLSYGSDALPYIEEMDSAKVVWDQLAVIMSTKVNWEPEVFYEASEVIPEEVNEEVKYSLEEAEGEAGKPGLGRPVTRYIKRKESICQELKILTYLILGGKITPEQTTTGDYTWAVPLNKALQEDDWEKTKRFFQLQPNLVTMPIDEEENTALTSMTLIRKGQTALDIAAQFDDKEMAEVLVKKNGKLLCMANWNGDVPVVVAAIYSNRNMLQYLYSVTPNEQIESVLVIVAMQLGVYDIPLDFLRRYPLLVITPDDNGESFMGELATNPSEVEMVVHPMMRSIANLNGKLPRELFTEEHKELLTQGEKWIKETSQYLMVVATLIATVMFAATFTIPVFTRDRLKQTKEKLVSPLTIHRKPNSKKKGDLEMEEANDRLTILEMTDSDLTSTVRSWQNNCVSRTLRRLPLQRHGEAALIGETARGGNEFWRGMETSIMRG
ncbi:hypothetical protein GIB67_036206 [Kingdonia uniflora]|uniref:PGG domain-containing protein n=1 Tax=Kingdonia uniflora TaxID=39325 RepID=A0A7J7L4V2_9MAGN|nr:hypothetical protein GIB67_036206 [Kingdonia uniflora]